MQKFILLLKESARELKKVQTITIVAMLAAINSVLGFFTIMIGDFIKIGFSFLSLAIAGMLYGPVVGGVLGGLGDILNYIIRPTGPFFPGFTLNAVLSGFIYGLFLYKKQISIRRIFFTKLLLVFLVDLCLTTTWLSILYGKAFMILLPMRALKAFIMLPIETVVLYIVLSRITAIFHLKTEAISLNTIEK